MTDIVERLRTGRMCDDKCRVMEAKSGCLCAEAADEIEKLREALLDIVAVVRLQGTNCGERVLKIARAALEEK